MLPGAGLLFYRQRFPRPGQVGPRFQCPHAVGEHRCRCLDLDGEELPVAVDDEVDIQPGLRPPESQWNLLHDGEKIARYVIV